MNDQNIISTQPKTGFINPFTDYGFKKIFGEEASKVILINFLNSILPKHHQIAELRFKNTEQLGQTAEDRKSIYDIYCQSITGEMFIVELQRIRQNYFKDRTVYYATFPIVEQAKQGKDWLYQLKPIYCISILDFKLQECPSDQVIHTIELKDQNNQVFYDKLTFIYFEMPKFNKSEHELNTELDKWLFYIKNLKELNVIPQVFQGNQVFEQAFKKAQLANLNREEWISYENSLKTYRDNLASEQAILQQGIQQGIQQGALKTAINLKKLGVSLDAIEQATGLSIEDIQAL